MHVTECTTTILKALACLLIIKVVMVTSAQISSQTGCHNSDVFLSCPSYNESQSNETSLRWKFKDTSTNTWKKLAAIRKGNHKLYSASSAFNGRLTIYPNGSLKIASLKPDDETYYQCIIRTDNPIIYLRVRCDGQFSKVIREVCVEEDVVLECPSKHRTNPRNFKELKWHKKNASVTFTSWSLVAASNESSARVDDGFQLHDNGSLTLPEGREEGDDMYKCDVNKMDGSRKESHVVHVKNLKCREISANIKTTKGRVSMTTATPLKGTDVVMETSTVVSSVIDATTEASAPALQTVPVLSVSPTTENTMVCGGLLNSPVGTFHSPNFPSSYPANSLCKWTIGLAEGYAARIDITLDRLNLEHEDDCQHDYVAIYDELENQIACRYCGTRKSPIQVQVRGRQAVIVFRSDNSVNKSGFKASYRAH